MIAPRALRRRYGPEQFSRFVCAHGVSPVSLHQGTQNLGLMRRTVVAEFRAKFLTSRLSFRHVGELNQ